MESSMLFGIMFFPAICLIGMKTLNDDDHIIGLGLISFFGMIFYAAIVAHHL